MVRIWARFVYRIGFANVFLLMTWTLLVHQIEAPLPRLLYSPNRTAALFLWEADCPSLIAICDHDRLVMKDLNYDFSVAEWSPDGAYIAVYLSESWAIYPTACLLGDGQCTPWRLDATANDTRVAWGPNGTTLAYITDSNSATMKILTRGCWDDSEQRCFEQTVRVASRGVLRQPTWSADGSRFVFLGIQPAGLYRLDADCLDVRDGCTDEMKIVVNMSAAYWPTLSADGSQLLYYAQPDNGVDQLYRADLGSGGVWQLTFRRGGAMMPAWSRDDRYVAFAGFENRSGGDLGIYVLDVERQLIALAVQQHGLDLTFPAWSP